MSTRSISANLFSDLKTKIETRHARVAIIGLGYVGLPLALLYSDQKFPVTGFDIDPRKVETLSQGGSYIFRIPSEEIQGARARGFSATADYSRLTEMDAMMICVPTPLNEYHEPDLSYITNTAHAIAPYLRAGHLVILESTTYPGTTEEVLVPILEKENRAGLKAARNGPVRRAVILLSDGQDNQSRVTREEAIEMAQRADVIVYSISTNVSGVKQSGDKVLERIAEATGGRAFFPFQMTDVSNAFAEIQDELRSQYLVAYIPDDFQHDGRYRTIDITAHQKKQFHVRARHGYYAPAR